jgi:hypothetical protein
MGIARLLAKGWIVFCLFAGAHALRLALISGQPLPPSLFMIGICVILFAAMGLLFAGGFGVSAGLPGTSFKARLGFHHVVPGFNEIVFLLFVCLSFANQAWFAPLDLHGNVVGPLEQASPASARWSRRWMLAAWMAGVSSPPPSPGFWR